MNTKEVAKLIAILQEYYPREVPATSLSAKVAAWELILGEYSYQEAQAAVIAWEKTSANGFCPTPGMLVGKIYELRKMNELSEPEAWELVMKALRNSTYSAIEEFKKLPELVQKIVGSPMQLKEWVFVDSKELQTVIRSGFTRSFRAATEIEVKKGRLQSGDSEKQPGISSAQRRVIDQQGQ